MSQTHLNPKRFFGQIAALSVIAIVAAVASGCGKKSVAATPAQISVNVARPLKKAVTEWDEFPGRLSSVASVEVRARVSGYIASTHFKEGAEVKQGDLLFVIDPRTYEAEYARAKADLARAKSVHDLAVLEADRATKLIEEQAISVESSQSKAKAREGAEAALQAAQAAVESAKLQLEFSRVTAPISGRVGKKIVTEGNLITGGAKDSTILTTIVSLDPIYCYFDVDERSALKYRDLKRKGTRESALSKEIPAQMQLANESGFPHEGKVDFVENELNPNTGAIQARGVFPNPDRLMSPGFFARLRIPGTGQYDAMLIRDAAVGSDQGKPFVYTADAEGKITQRHVVLGPLEDGLRIVREGIGPDDRVVVNGLLSVRGGSVVKTEEVPMKPENATATASAAAR